jgi:hypothetical protein
MQGSQVVDSPIPRVLLRSPRTVRRKPGTVGVFVVGRILTAPLLATVAALLIFSAIEPIVVFLIPAQPARIIAQWCDFKSHRGITFYVQYQLDHSRFIGVDEVLPIEYETYKVGQAVKAHVIHLGRVGYSSLDRSLRNYAHNRMILWYGAGVGLAISSILFYALWLTPGRARWLAKNGKATFGAVVAKSIFHNGRRQIFFSLTYQFKALGKLRARRIRINSQRYDSAELKDLVIILFDPAHPRRNIVYDYCDFVVS